MKRRFVLTIGLVLAFALTTVGILNFLMLRTEQDRLIDSRIEATASHLLLSNLSKADLQEFEEAEDIIKEVIGGERFNQFIVIYGLSGKVLYRSRNAVGLPKSIPHLQKWQTIETDEHTIRVLTIPIGESQTEEPVDKRDTRILQTGLILDDQLLRVDFLSRHLFVYSGLVLAVVLLTSIWLSRTLLRPLNDFALYLKHLSASFDMNLSVEAHDSALKAAAPTRHQLAGSEFVTLMAEAEKLREVVSQGLRNTQVWTAQMAHELRTPLTILQNTLEMAREEGDAVQRDQRLREAASEIVHLNSVISSFLEWSAAENDPALAQDLHAIKIATAAREIVERMERQYPGRTKIEGESDLTIFVKKGFLRQALSNLVTNALQYSPSNSIVTLRLEPHRIEIADLGSGVPRHVLESLGRPFNHGEKSNGFGLGLAWVQTICRKYGWKLSFESDAHGTRAQISFPPESARP